MLATDIAFAQPIGSASPDIRTGVYRGRVVTYEIIDGLAVWDGDIVLGTPEELEPSGEYAAPGKALDSRKKALVAVSGKEGLWPGGIIPYVIDPELSNPNDVLDAIQHWNESTVIRLVERTDQPNWVRFVPSDGCRANVGMVGGEQKVWLTEGCGVSGTIHEIGHTVGLWHEHQRNDRNTYVWVSSDPFNPINFAYKQIGASALDSGPYDYGSVMHYGGFPEYMMTIPPSIPCGGRRGLSAGDIDGVNRLYGKIPTETTITTVPAGLMIEVDGESYTAPHSFDWSPGTRHMIGVTAPQKTPGDDYFRYLFAKWSDGGSQSHFVTASSSTTVFIANFIMQQPRTEARVSPPQGGTVRLDPPSADGFYTFWSFIKTFAEPAEGFSFERWQGGGRGNGPASNPKLGRVSSGWNNNTAFFTQRPLAKIDTNVPGSDVTVDGRWKSLPRNFAWEVGSTHTLGLLVREDTGHDGVIQPYFGFDDERLLFDGWSDGGDAAHDITVSGEPTTITANFTRQVLLDTVPGVTGSGVVKVEPSGLEGGQPGHTFHDLSSSVRLTAQPDPGFKLFTWRGDLSGSENPKSLLMDSRKRVWAIFRHNSQSFESARLISGEPVEWIDPGGGLAVGKNGYWINVPTGATQLAIHLVTATQAADVDLYANREHYPGGPRLILGENNEEIIEYSSQYLSTGPGGNKSITITPESSLPLEPGPYFIVINAHTSGVYAKGTLTAEVNISESAISANVPHFGFPASLFTKTVKDENPPPQALEIRNSLRGTLDYQITTDQSWLFVSPDKGSSTGETDTVQIAVDPANLKPGAFEGTITIAAPPAWPVKVPVTLIVTPEAPRTVLVANFANGNNAALNSRVYLFNPSVKTGRVTVRVFTLPLMGGLAQELTLAPLELGSLGSKSGLNIKLVEDILTPLGITTPYTIDGGNLTLEFTIQAADVKGTAQVFSSGFGFGTYPLQEIPITSGASPTVLVANFANGNNAAFNSRVYLWNPSTSAGEVTVRVFTLPLGGGLAQELTLAPLALGSLGARSALNVKLVENILTPLGVSLPYTIDGGNLTLEFTIQAADVKGAAQVFSSGFAFGTQPLQEIPPVSGGSPTVLVANFMNGNNAAFNSRVYLFNPSTSAGEVTVRVFTLPLADGTVQELTAEPLALDTLGSRSALNIKLAEDILAPLGIATPYTTDDGNLTLEFTIQAADVRGTAQVFSSAFASGTYTLQAVPSVPIPGPTRLVASFTNGNDTVFNSRISLFNPSPSAGDITVRVFTLPLGRGTAQELTTTPLELGTLEARSALDIRLAEDILVPLQITTPYTTDGGNLVLELTIQATDVQGTAQVFSSSLSLGTYPLDLSVAPPGGLSAGASFVLESANSGPQGITFANDRFHVVDVAYDKVYAYTVTGRRAAAADFDLDPDNSFPQGITFANGSFYVVDSLDGKVYAYTATGQRAAAADFDLDPDNSFPQGITFANGSFYVVDSLDGKVYAYTATGQRAAAADFDLPANSFPTRITFANDRFHVVDWIDGKVYAYTATGQRAAAADFDLDPDNSWPHGITFANDRFHVVDRIDDKVYAYMVSGQRDLAFYFNLDPANVDPQGITFANAGSMWWMSPTTRSMRTHYQLLSR